MVYYKFFYKYFYVLHIWILPFYSNRYICNVCSTFIKNFISFDIKTENVYGHIMLWSYWCANYFESMQWYKNKIPAAVLYRADIKILSKYSLIVAINCIYFKRDIIYISINITQIIYRCCFYDCLVITACYLIFCVPCKMIFCQKYHNRSFWWNSKFQTEISLRMHSSMNGIFISLLIRCVLKIPTNSV